jgi:hypothetical protein
VLPHGESHQLRSAKIRCAAAKSVRFGTLPPRRTSTPTNLNPDEKDTNVATPAKLTPLQESEARRLAEQAARANKVTRVHSDEEKAVRKERVARAKDAMSRSVGLKGAHVAPARAALKTFLQRLNEPNQPDDAHFDMLVEAPFRVPPKKRTNDRRF